MYYQILRPPKPFVFPSYRGVYRPGLRYQVELPETHPANCAWKAYVDAEEQIQDKATAFRLAEQMSGMEDRLDLVEVEVVAAEPKITPPGALGFDIAQHGWYSLLSGNLNLSARSMPGTPLDALFNLIELHFRPRLNEHGLFSCWNDARFFVDVVEAISTLAPGTWESPGHEHFEIYCLRLILDFGAFEEIGGHEHPG